MKIKTVAMILAFCCAGIVAQAQSQPAPTPTPSPTKEEKKRAKEVEKADKLFEKQEAKRLEKEEKRQRNEHLSSSPVVTISGAKAERVGQILTSILGAEGFTLTEYQQPQVVFGMATNYKAIYTKPVSDGSTDFNMRAWVPLTYGVRVEGSVSYFMGFVITDGPAGAVLEGRYGLVAPTIKGPALRDLSANESYRNFLDSVMTKTKDEAESEGKPNPLKWKPDATPSPTP